MESVPIGNEGLGRKLRSLVFPMQSHLKNKRPLRACAQRSHVSSGIFFPPPMSFGGWWESHPTVHRLCGGDFEGRASEITVARSAFSSGGTLRPESGRGTLLKQGLPQRIKQYTHPASEIHPPMFSLLAREGRTL